MFSFYSDIPKSNYSKLIFCPREEDPGLAVILLINITGADIKKKKNESRILCRHTLASLFQNLAVSVSAAVLDQAFSTS